MSLFRNKHVLTALIVMPILALVSYFAVGLLVGERPHAARQGESYPLVEAPGCRHGRSDCVLQNGDFQLVLVIRRDSDGQLVLDVTSRHPLDGVVVAVARSSNRAGTPVEMSAQDEAGMSWSMALAEHDPEVDRLQLATSTGNTHYYGDVALKFSTPDG